jgi:hypothetical protein
MTLYKVHLMGDVTTYTGDGEIVFSGPDGIKIINE